MLNLKNLEKLEENKRDKSVEQLKHLQELTNQNICDEVANFELANRLEGMIIDTTKPTLQHVNLPLQIQKLANQVYSLKHSNFLSSPELKE